MMRRRMEERWFDVRAEKPRRYGVTEMRGPHYTVMTQNAIQDILESRGELVDGLKFSGGSHSLFPRDFIKQLTHLAHQHQVYVSTGDWAEHLLRQCQGPSSFKQFLEECKHLGFDTIDLNVSSLKLPEETLLRLVRLIKSLGLGAKPLFDFPVVVPTNGAPLPPPPHSEVVEDVDLLLRRAERCLEAGADMIMIDADDLCKYADSLRSDVVAKIVGRLGLEKTMFEASNPMASEWFVRRYGPRVNLFVDHSQVTNLECLRGYNFGRHGTSTLRSPHFLL